MIEYIWIIGSFIILLCGVGYAIYTQARMRIEGIVEWEVRDELFVIGGSTFILICFWPIVLPVVGVVMTFIFTFKAIQEKVYQHLLHKNEMQDVDDNHESV